ncbi:zinc finger BED domain-containing protein 5-like [Scomber scombrus]|uniref:zinc finger BED domain-containing protein 5-like n=1 Tax=Scomber scombrus TaxID=13677 RepID=UPI002DDAC20A|nr:zinc finger BED domain-containing protein 5-like [Scomber scombrus]
MDRWLATGQLKRSESSITDTESTSDHPVAKQKRKVRRKYSDEYLGLGFHWTGSEAEPLPLCLVCLETLSNEALKPCKLRRHLETKHGEYVTKPLQFFENKLKEYQSKKKVMEGRAMGNDNAIAVETSYLLSELIAKTGKPHTDGETFLLPGTKIIVEKMLGEKALQPIKLISLSDNTVKRRIDDMADNVLDQLIQDVKASRFYAIQLDESTDIANIANLLAYIRYEKNAEIKEDFLFCRPLPTHSTAEAIFDVLNTFILSNGIEWSKCVGLSTDGARAMLGQHSGVVSRVKAVAPLANSVHCSIHREALAAKKMPVELKTVLDQAVKAVNFIKSRPLQSRLFGVLCGEMGSDHKQLLLHTEVRWLSRGKVLTRLFELRDEVRLFFLNSKFELAHCFNNFEWLAKLAYLADIFSHLNSLSLALQGSAVSVFKVQHKVEATIRKLAQWKKRVDQGNYDSFENMSDFLTKEETRLPNTVTNAVKEHLEGLKTQLREYFPALDAQCSWIENPFEVQDEALAVLSAKEQDGPLDLSYDTALKLVFLHKHLINFWLHVASEYPDLADKAVRYLMPFPTTYLCESGFSALVAVKTKYRNKLNVEPDLRLRLSSIEPDIKYLVGTMQHQPSH